MLSVKTNNNKINIIIISLFISLFFLTRLIGLSTDEINPDGVNWVYRSQQFVVALKTKNFENTYQHYHPGVTLMWITGIPIEAVKQITNQNVINKDNFQLFYTVAKACNIIVQLVLTLLVLYFLSRLIKFLPALFTVSIFTFEPFFIGNSRLYHMDILLSLFIFLSMIFLIRSLESDNTVNRIFTGFILALSFLTKSIGIGALIFVLCYGFFYFLKNHNLHKFPRFLLQIFISFVFFMFLFFPALWVKPVYVLQEIFAESERVGVRKGHEQIVLGEVTTEAGFSFYPLVILLKTSPFTLLGFFMFFGLACYSVIKNKGISVKDIYSDPLFIFSIFYIGYFMVMSLPTKKLDRYMLPEYPFFAVCAVYGYYWVYLRISETKKIKNVYYAFLTLSITFFIILPFFSLFPYYFTYTSPLVGSAVNANKIIAQKPFGIGVYELKDRILEKYGDYPKLGFYDTKPMGSIYPNSKIFDVREYGTGSYDLLVLGINEVIPEKVEKSSIKFRLDSSIFINGLEYWRIYVKER